MGIKDFIKKTAEKHGYEIVPSVGLIRNIEEDFKEIYRLTKNYTTTSRERRYVLYKAVEYVVKAKIPGDLVECGVWKGGSSMIMAYTLLKMGDNKRKIWLYDTYAGMSKPTEEDKTFDESSYAIDYWKKSQRGNYNLWAFSPIAEVKKNMLSTGYPEKNLIFIKGKIEETIPKEMPSKISILRLDSDWYESTYHSIKYLFPLLSPGGVLILDDYGAWAGAKKAVDKYFKEKNINILLSSIDNDSRIGIKIKK
jgi:O-methyltransferase